jgi:tRNA (guanine-N7-)-methyltransferase
MRMRKKPNLPQRIEKCGPLYVTVPAAYRGEWLGRIPGYKALELEIGCGRGRFTVETAKTQPETLLVAVERVPEAMIIGLERACREEAHNIRFVDSDAAYLDKMFAPGELDAIYINFCDPWPSNRHAKRRLTHANFLRIYRVLLRLGGELRFKTDNSDLFEYSLESLELNGFELSEVTRDLHGNGPSGIMTDYEQKFHEQGVSINRCVAKLKTYSEVKKD